MRSTLLFFILFGVIVVLSAQPLNEKKTKTVRVYENGKLTFYDSSNTEGKTVFFKLIQDLGTLVINNAIIYDSTGRVQFSIGCHSNLGFSIEETDYSNNLIYHYDYPCMAVDSINSQASYYLQIDSYEKLMNHPFVKQALDKKVRYLNYIEVANERGNITHEYAINNSGDTTQINTYEYDENHNEISFHYGDLEDTNWVWDIYSNYDSLNNKFINYRMEHGSITEMEFYDYNSKKQLLKHLYYNEKVILENMTEYFYFTNGKLKKELFYETSLTKPVVISKYKYDKMGKIKLKKEIDFREPKKQERKFSRYVYTYY